MTDTVQDHPTHRAFQELIRRHHGRVYAAARRIVATTADAEDVTQQVFLRVLEGGREYSEGEDAGRRLVWLASRLALNTLRSARRRHGIEKEYAMAKDREFEDLRVESDEVARVVRREIAALPELQRLSLVLRYQQGLTLADAAGLLTCAESTVHDRIRAGLERLRQRLRHLGFAVAPAALPGLVEAEGRVAVPASLESRLLELAAAKAAVVAVSTKPLLLGAVLFVGLVGFAVLGPESASPTGLDPRSHGMSRRIASVDGDDPLRVTPVRSPWLEEIAPPAAAGGAAGPTAARPPHHVRVRVVDAEGKAVVGAGVEVLADYRSILTGETDAKGHVDLELPADAKVQWILALRDKVGFDYFENYATSLRLARPAASIGSEVELVLDGARRLRLHARTSAGGALAGVGFVPWMLGMKDKRSFINLTGSRLARVQSDAGGTAVLGWLPADLDLSKTPTTGVCVTSHQYTWPDQPDDLLGAEKDTEVTAVLSEKLRVTGTVVDAAGRGQGGILVHAEGRGRPGKDFFWTTAVTDEQGGFTVLLAPGQQYMVMAADRDRVARSLHFALTKDDTGKDLRLELRPGTRIHGRLLRSGSADPVAGVRVMLATRNPLLVGPPLSRKMSRIEYPGVGLVRETRTDAQGRYSFQTADAEHLLVASGTAEATIHSPVPIAVGNEVEITKDLTWTGTEPGVMDHIAPFKIRGEGRQDYGFWLLGSGEPSRESRCAQCHLPR